MRQLLAVAITAASWLVGVAPIAAQPATGAADAPVYVVYYWKAKPGQVENYSAYITGTAEGIDESARQAGAFIDVTTVLATTPAEGPAPDWTHLRMFKLANLDAVAKLGAALDAATARVVPDEAQRTANAARSAGMRDFVRREVWTTLR